MKRLITVLVAVALVVTACSSADDSADETVTTTTAAATTTTAAPTTTAPATTTTAAPTTTTEAPAPEIPTSPVVPGDDEDADAIVEVYAVVFDSSTTYADKEPFIEDPTGLEGTVEAYANAGEAVGGIFLEVTETGTDGDLAAVVYDLLFGENPFQQDQPGDAVRNDGQWQVTREFFCSIMERARVGCP